MSQRKNFYFNFLIHGRMLGAISFANYCNDFNYRMGPTDETKGHTKGVLIANDTSGMWLIHSVPKFPPTPEEGSYGYPKSGMVYGQSFLCISLTGDQLGKVGRQLQYNEPHFYFGYIPEYLKS